MLWVHEDARFALMVIFITLIITLLELKIGNLIDLQRGFGLSFAEYLSSPQQI